MYLGCICVYVFLHEYLTIYHMERKTEGKKVMSMWVYIYGLYYIYALYGAIKENIVCMD